jgi:Carboxypeptidase regulatory-like domain/TonB dependent receptor
MITKSFSMLRSQIVHSTLLAAALLSGEITLCAQTQVSSADLKGTVFDSAKAVVPGATVTAANVSTGVTRSTTTDQLGGYRMPLLPPGDYEVTVQKAGFAPLRHTGITITVGQTAVIDFDLQVGSVTSEVEVVTDEAPVIEVERTHQADTITQRPIQVLPTNGRNFLNFSLLTAGVVEESPAVTNSLLPQLPTSRLSFAGQNGRANNVTIDGVDNNDIADNAVRPTISQEAVQEFQINRSSFKAEFGRVGGGAINIVSKGGTNHFRGSLFEYFRHERLDARNAFATALSKDPPFKRNQPGFTVSGPIRKDKTFFFVAYEGLIRRESAFTSILTDPSILQPTPGQQEVINTLVNSNIPALVAQGQMFAALLTTTPDSPFPSAAQPFPINRMTYDLLSRSTGSFPVHETQSASTFRIDNSFSERDQLLFRHTLTNDSQHGTGIGFGNIGRQQGPTAGYDIAIHDQAWVAGENHIFSARAINEFRFQFIRNIFNLDSTDPYGPRINITGIGSFGRDFNVPSDRTQHRYQWLDNYTHAAGRHSFKMGGDFNHISFDTRTAVFLGGSMSFTQLPIPPAALLVPAQTSQLASLLSLPPSAGGLGRPDLVPVITTQPLTTIQQFNFGLMRDFTQGFGNPFATLSTKQLGLYFQDTFEVIPSLHLDLGLRYDFEAQPAGIHRDKNNFGPRFGFAWSPGANRKMVIRGGAGAYFQPLYSATAFAAKVLGKDQQITSLFVSADPRFTPISPNSLCGMAIGPAGQPSFCFFQQLVGGGVLKIPATQEIPEGAWQSLLGLTRATSTNKVVQRVDDGVVNPYNIQASFGVDRQLARDWNVSINYLMNRGVKLLRNRQVNALPNPLVLDPFGQPTLTTRANPSLLVDYSIETAGNSIYHGMAVSVNRRFGNHYQIISSYTFGKAIDDTTDISQNLGPQDPTNTRLERGLSSFDVRQRFALAAVLESPFKARALADFDVSPILTAHTGSPFNITSGVDSNGDTNDTDRPFLVGRNTGRGPGYFTTDLRISRRFRFSPDGSRAVQLTFDAFNLFNRVNFKDVNSNTNGVLRLSDLGISDVQVKGRKDLPASSFGAFTSAFDARNIQFGIKMLF